MYEHTNHSRPEPRSFEEILGDLQRLAQSDGALHEISAIIYRDWVVTIDTQEGRVVDDPEYRWSTSRLNTNELLLLLGLSVQATNDRIFAIEANDNTFSDRAGHLLREFHDRILRDSSPLREESPEILVTDPEAIGLIAREAIYYGAESFYLHQFVRFARQRYREDATWLVQNAGLSIRPMIDIANFIIDRINNQMTAVGQLRNEGHEFSHGELTNSLLISKEELRSRYRDKADAFIANFATAATRANTNFTNPFTVNDIAIKPIIDLGDHIYVPNQYRISETIYESPFYWMMRDKAYCNIASENRGKFLEKSTAHIFRSVFGPDNVFENVTVWQNAKHIAGEIDTLVIFGEFALVVQAKSKRITLKARAGDSEALRNDFEGAIQAPYRQAVECIDHIRNGARCTSIDEEIITFPIVPWFFPVVILSDPFPASTLLSRTLLDRGSNVAPAIWDLGALDCIARLLPSPIEMIFYLKCRSDVFDRALSDSEYNFLGFHIRSKLALSDDIDMLVIERDFATVVDDYMISADVGVTAERPLGILESTNIPIISAMLAELRHADPRLAAVVVELYDASIDALEDLSARILEIRSEVSNTGKAIKAISVQTKSGGLTYAVTRCRDKKAALAAEAIGAKHKYDTKRDRWYVILDSLETSLPIDGLLPLVWPWREDEQEAKSSEQVGQMFNSQWVPSVKP